MTDLNDDTTGRMEQMRGLPVTEAGNVKVQGNDTLEILVHAADRVRQLVVEADDAGQAVLVDAGSMLTLLVMAAETLAREREERTRTPELEEALVSACESTAFDSRDWSLCKCDAWLYGLLCGWDDEAPDPDDVDAMGEVAARHGWTDETVARLRRLRRAINGTAP